MNKIKYTNITMEENLNLNFDEDIPICIAGKKTIQ